MADINNNNTVHLKMPHSANSEGHPDRPARYTNKHTPCIAVVVVCACVTRGGISRMMMTMMTPRVYIQTRPWVIISQICRTRLPLLLTLSHWCDASTPDPVSTELTLCVLWSWESGCFWCVDDTFRNNIGYQKLFLWAMSLDMFWLSSEKP